MDKILCATDFSQPSEGALECACLPVERVELHQHGPGGVVAMRHHEDRDIAQTQPCQIGLHPELGGQPRHARPEAGGQPPAPPGVFPER